MLLVNCKAFAGSQYTIQLAYMGSPENVWTDTKMTLHGNVILVFNTASSKSSCLVCFIVNIFLSMSKGA